MRKKKQKIKEKEQAKITKEFVNAEFLESSPKEEKLEEEVEVKEEDFDAFFQESGRRTAAILQQSDESQSQPIEQTLQAVPITNQGRRTERPYEAAINAPQYSASYEQRQEPEPTIRVRRFEEFAESTARQVQFQSQEAGSRRQEMQEETRYKEVKRAAEEERTRIPGSRRERKKESILN